jgi:2-polyprenyl-3-methyl-5-hydroxy-6-metoxy-1,4-benzoquinol methylase
MLENSEKEMGLLSHYNNHPNYWSSINNKDNINRLIDLSGLSIEGKEVLDMGCGDGRLLKILEGLGIKRYVGVDYSSIRIDKAKRIESGIDFEFFNSSAQDFLSKDIGRYDVCFMFEFIEHLENPKGVIEATKEKVDYIFGSVPLNHVYEAHLQVYKSNRDVEERLGCKVLFNIKNKHDSNAFFIIQR